MATVGLSKEIYVIRDPAIHIAGVSGSGQFWQCLQKDLQKAWISFSLVNVRKLIFFLFFLVQKQIQMLNFAVNVMSNLYEAKNLRTGKPASTKRALKTKCPFKCVTEPELQKQWPRWGGPGGLPTPDVQ